MKTFGQVRNYLDSIPDINFGGCGIAALAMYRWLKANGELTPETKFVYYHSSKYHLDRNRAASNGDYKKAMSCNHVALYHEGRKWDSEGIVIRKEDLMLLIDDEETVIHSLNNNISEWNWSFDRDMVPDIAENLGIDLSDVKLRDSLD